MVSCLKIRGSEQKGLNGFGLLHELEIQVQCLTACHKLLACLCQFCMPRKLRLKEWPELCVSTPPNPSYKILPDRISLFLRPFNHTTFLSSSWQTAQPHVSEILLRHLSMGVGSRSPQQMMQRLYSLSSQPWRRSNQRVLPLA